MKTDSDGLELLNYLLQLQNWQLTSGSVSSQLMALTPLENAVISS